MEPKEDKIVNIEIKIKPRVMVEYIVVDIKIENPKPETLIGKKYYPIDNSYNKYISGEDLGEYPYLAGCWNENQKETIIVSEPYEEEIKGIFLNEKYIHTFVNVLYQNSIYRVLYFKHGLEKKEDYFHSKQDNCIHSNGMFILDYFETL